MLLAARKKQWRTFFLIAALISVLSAITFFIIAFTAGISIVVRPDDANKSSEIKILNGLGVFISGAMYTVSSETEVLISAPGFWDQTLLIKSNKRGKTIEVVLKELPGQLTVSTVPELDTVRWKINGKRAGISPILEAELHPGTYHLEVDHKYFEKDERDIKIQRNKNIDIEIPLRPIKGTMSIGSTPKGAKVIINDEDIGTTPLQTNLNGGKFEIVLSLDGYQGITNTVEITREKTAVERNYRLIPVISQLRFKVTPSGGTLIVNGKKVGAQLTYPVLSGKELTASYSKEGYYPQEKKTSLKPGQTKTVNFDLKAEYGRVKIISKPSAKVTINGKGVGSTPISIKLLAKTHVVLVERPGYRLFKKTIIPTSTRITKILVNLQTEKVAQLKDAPKSYTNDVGMELILFEPTPFTMGAPRHEKGQRANEFLRQIKLSRPFYAGTHEVTIEQYSKFRPDRKAARDVKFPITSVTWFDAVTYCNWLSSKEKLEPFYEMEGSRLLKVNKKANGYRLLSEAEWEWLARKANRPNINIFSWGDKSIVPSMAGNIADESSKGLSQFFVPNYTDGYAEIAPVGTFKKELSGLFDLTGNVREWVHDTYSVQPPVSNIIEIDPISTSLGRNRVVKGSSWRSGTRSTLRAAYRNGLVNRQDDVGFRVGRYL